VQHQDGSGDLILQSEPQRDTGGDTRTRQSGFLAINEVRSAERLVQALGRTAVAATPRAPCQVEARL
jgi:hypothetical protein